MCIELKIQSAGGTNFNYRQDKNMLNAIWAKTVLNIKKIHFHTEIAKKILIKLTFSYFVVKVGTDATNRKQMLDLA